MTFVVALVLVIAGFAVTAWVFAPAFAGQAAARRLVGTHRLALGSLVVVLVINTILTSPFAGTFRRQGLTSESFLLAAFATQFPLLLVPYLRVVLPGAVRLSGLGFRRLPLERLLGFGLGGALAALAISAAIGVVLDQLGIHQNQMQEFSFVHEAGLPVFLLVLVDGSVLAPFAEETFFRGFLFGLYRQRRPRLEAYAVSGLLFALLHTQPQSMDLVENAGLLVAIFALGTLLAWIYERTGSLYPGMIAHGLNNGIALVAFYAFGIT